MSVLKQSLLPGIIEENELDLNKTVNAKHEAAKFLIFKFLKKTPKNWGKEIKAAQKVITVHPEILSLELPFKLNSLLWFLTPEGKIAVNKYLYGLKTCQKPETNYTISDQKFGEDKVLPTKPKSFKEFLD